MSWSFWHRYVVWPLQRAYRGWDDRAVWSLDDYLAAWMPDVLARIRDYDACPMGMTHEEWLVRLDRMIAAFVAIQEQHDIEPGKYDEADRTIRLGLASFCVHFRNLWT